MRKHHKHSLMGRLERFFEENPDEELTYADIAAKFGVSVRAAQSRVCEAIAQGEALESVHVIRRRVVRTKPEPVES